MRRRTLLDRLFWGGAWLAFVFIAAPAIAVVMGVFHQAWPAFGWSLFVNRTNTIGVENGILGTLMLLVGVLVIAGTIGVAAGIYLAEYAGGRTEQALRFFSEVLSGSPSIVIGYIGYITLVIGFHWGYSYMAAVIALSVLILPYIVRTTEVSLRQVPTTLREASSGLGIARWKTVSRVILPPAVPGILSGLVVALAISTGETAPLLFTAGYTDNNPSLSLFHHQLGYLTGVTYTDISIPGSRAHAIAAAAGAVTLIMLVILIALSKVISARSRRSMERASL
ncbi:MAG TPA: phosphate ABC transporter permease PstA [Acidimicrobiales bacterium]|nr:phosphate ABC transporter permease PstA [Acidimicrobiales bacterium]